MSEFPDFSYLNAESSPEDFIKYGHFLSRLHALSDGSPVPPTARHAKEARRQGYGPSIHPITLVMGAISIWHEKLGFATSRVVQKWPDETYIDNGKWLSHMIGSVEQPKAITWPDLEQASVLNIGPHPTNILKRFGSMEEYNDKLGFVTAATLERWTDEDWAANGRWISHLLGSADDPKMPSQADLRTTSKLGISPSVHAIYEKYGSLYNYQKALGFDNPWKKDLDYPEWDRQTFIDNGIWFSHVLGSPAHPKMPTQNDLKEGGKLGLCPPAFAITKRFNRLLSSYQDALGFVTSATWEHWTDQGWINNGIWLSHMIGSPEDPIMPTWDTITAASNVRIAPPPDRIIEKFGSILDYQEALGFYNHMASSRIPNRELLRRGQDLIRANGGHPLTKQAFKEAGMPLGLLQKRFSGISNFQALLDIPNYANWQEDELIAFGVTWAINHGGNSPSRTVIKQLREKQKGPSHKHINAVFGSYKSFRAAVDEAVPAYMDVAKEISETGLGEELAHYLLRDFRRGEEYREERLGLAEDLQSLIKKRALKRLQEKFARSRLTIRWDEGDFLLFGQDAFDAHSREPENCKVILAILNRAGLSPYLEDIEEVFGSEEDFIGFVVGEIAQAA